MKKTIIVVSIVLFVVLLAGSGSFYYFYYLNGPCGVSKVDNSAKGIAGLMSRWEDAEAIASKTPRMSLSSQISNLQQIKRDA